MAANELISGKPVLLSYLLRQTHLTDYRLALVVAWNAEGSMWLRSVRAPM